MADKIDMSLDDIIKNNKGGGGRGGFGRRGGRGRGGFGSRGGRRDGERSFRGSGRGRGGSFPPSRSPYSRGDSDRPWSHDLFDGPRRGGISVLPDAASSKLVVSNLDYAVTDSDIRELFSEFGRLRQAAVHYDKSGRSLGSAEVEFDRRSDAIKAVKQYNGVPLDGKPMRIELVVKESALSRPRPVSERMGYSDRRSSYGRVEKSFRSPGRGSSRPGGRGGSRGGSRGGNRGGPAPTKEDLDKELDSYLKAR